MDYSNDKIKIIQNYSEDELLTFLNEINNPLQRKILNELLCSFVPKTLANEHNNAVKYGDKTKYKYIEALKGKSKGYFSDSKKKNKISPQEKATMLLSKFFFLWKESNFENEYVFAQEYMHINNIDKPDFNFTDINFLYFLVDKNKDFKIAKEIIKMLYQFGPCEKDSKLESLLRNCKTQVDILNYEKKQFNSKTAQEVKEEITSLKKKISEQQQEIDFLNNEKEILKNDLERSNKVDLDKVKNSYAQKIESKNLEIESLKNQLEEYEDLVMKNEELISENRTLERFRDFKIEDLNKVLEDKEYGKSLLHLILANRTASKIIVKKLNLKEEVISEGYKYYEQEFIDQNIELERLRQLQKELEKKIKFSDEEKNTKPIEISVNKNIFVQFDFDNNFKLFSDENFMAFIQDYSANLNITLEKAISMHRHIMENNFIVLDSKNEIDSWIKAQGMKIPRLDVIVEHNWNSYEDWFGRFNNKKFIPAKSLISDFYCFIKENKDIPTGVIIFNDFNEIMPEIYLYPFIKNLEINNYIDLVHPNYEVDNEYIKIKRLEKTKRLKFIFIKSQNTNAFDIPCEMVKYELRDDNE